MKRLMIMLAMVLTIGAFGTALAGDPDYRYDKPEVESIALESIYGPEE